MILDRLPGLVRLNHRIVARLRFLREVDAHYAMMDFKNGDNVTIHPPGRMPIVGTLVRYNRKSVTVVAETGSHWTVAPQILRHCALPDGDRQSGRCCSAEAVQLRQIRRKTRPAPV